MSTPDEIREIVRAVIREELAALAPANMPLYRILARRREDLGLTQEQVGKDLGFSTATIGSWETGRLPMKSAEMYADYLGVVIIAVEKVPGSGPPLVTNNAREPYKARAKRRYPPGINGM